MLNRREALGTIGKAALTASAGCATLTASAAPAVAHDPMMEALRKYRADTDWFNGPATNGFSDKEMNAARDASWGPFYEALHRGEVPSVTSEAGAVAALRAALEEDASCDPVMENLLKASLAYFDGRA